MKHRELFCDSATHSGTFIVEIPTKCSKSVYEIGGIPFSIAQNENIYKSPASILKVKNIDGDCNVKAYVDSHPFQLNIPFTWVTTNKHTWFSIHVDGRTIVDKADTSLFSSVSNGVWVAYTYDLNVRNKQVEVTGNGDDIIHVYGV